MQTLNLLAGIAYDPTIRGLLSVGVGVVVLMGSVYLILATNTGNRLGFLLAATGFFGWMTIMGIIWWIYGIGMLGKAASWHVTEYVAGDVAGAATDRVTELDLASLPVLGGKVDYEAVNALFEENPAGFKALNEQLSEDSGGWKFLPPSDPSRGEAEATVAAALPGCKTCPFGIEAASDYIVLEAFEVGGKTPLPDNPDRLDRITTKLKQAAQITHPIHYAVVQVQKVIEQEAKPGQAPPIPEADPTEPVISVIMERDIGDKRFPSAVIAIGSGLIFGLLSYVLHKRERILEANLAAAGMS